MPFWWKENGISLITHPAQHLRATSFVLEDHADRVVHVVQRNGNEDGNDIDPVFPLINQNAQSLHVARDDDAATGQAPCRLEMFENLINQRL